MIFYELHPKKFVIYHQHDGVEINETNKFLHRTTISTTINVELPKEKQ